MKFLRNFEHNLNFFFTFAQDYGYLAAKYNSYMKKKILILDDKETIAKVLSIYLMSDYDVQWLPDGLQGVKWLQAGNTPDLIISDIRMPGMRGDDFLPSRLASVVKSTPRFRKQMFCLL